MGTVLTILGFVVICWLFGTAAVKVGEMLMQTLGETIAKNSNPDSSKLLERMAMIEEAEQYERSRREALERENEELRVHIAELEASNE